VLEKILLVELVFKLRESQYHSTLVSELMFNQQVLDHFQWRNQMIFLSKITNKICEKNPTLD
jgi:hypothetical protein